MTRRRWAALLGLVLLGRLLSPVAVPVYDGVGQPDEPYRYVGGAPAPGSATVTVRAVGGRSPEIRLETAERGPQVVVDLAPGSFAAEGALTVAVRPVAAAGERLAGGVVDGNAYEVTASPGATYRDQAALVRFVQLRAAVMTEPPPGVLFRENASAPWRQLRTTLAGRDVLAAAFAGPGQYALLRPAGAEPLGARAALSGARLAVAAGGVLLLVVVTVLLLRRGAARNT